MLLHVLAYLHEKYAAPYLYTAPSCGRPVEMAGPVNMAWLTNDSPLKSLYNRAIHCVPDRDHDSRCVPSAREDRSNRASAH